MKMKFLPKTLTAAAVIAAAALMLFTGCDNFFGPVGPQPREYTVTYNINGGSGSAPSAESVNAGSSVTLANQSGWFSRSGYTFGGWNILSSGNGTNYDAGSSFKPAGNITFFAKWNIAVTFNLNGGSGTAPAVQAISPGSSIYLPGGSGFTRDGFTFGGWSTSSWSGDGVTYSAWSYFTPSNNTVLYAVWIPIYTVTYNLNGGSGTAPSAQSVGAGNSVSIPSGIGLSRDGFAFVGWNTSSFGTGTDYAPWSSFTPSGNTTMFAKWIPVYTVTYDINNGIGTTPGAQPVNQGNSVSLPGGSGFSRSGFTFGGWNTLSSGTGTNYAAQSSFAPSGNITLYAVWIPRYTVTYDINGGSGSTPAAQTVDAGSSVSLASQSGWFFRSDYSFAGWNTDPDGTGDNYEVWSSFTPSGNVTLYARWTATIVYNVNGGSGTPPAAQIVNAGESVSLADGSGFFRTGYTFGGWSTGSSCGGDLHAAGSSFTLPGNITLFARWNVTVSYDFNGGTSLEPFADQTVCSGNSIAIPTAVPARAGFTFGGWNTNSSGTGTSYSAGSSFTPSSNVTLFARWNATLTYNINGGSGTTPAAQTTSPGNAVWLADNSWFSRSGYTFGGWSNTSTCAGANFSTGIGFMLTRDTVMYARWNATVTYNMNGGTGTTPTSQTVCDGNSVTLANQSGLFSRIGYTFGGWNTASDGTGDNYSVGSSFTPQGNITLYARWYTTVSYSINGGSGTPPSSSIVNAGNSLTLPVTASGFSRSGFTFGGWSTASNCAGTVISSVTPSRDTVMYARWNSAVTYDLNGAAGSPPAVQAVCEGNSVTLAGAASRTGYTFGGWNTNASGTGTDYSAGAIGFIPSGNITLFAKWDPITYTVTYDINDGTGTGPVAQMGSIADQVTLPDGSGFTMDGFTFGGWNTNSSGTGTNYNAGSSFTPSSNITLYARWVRIIIDGGTLSYGGQNYRTVIIGGKRWMAENLNYAGAGGDVGVCYGGSESNCNTYGRLYTWTEAMGISSTYATTLWGGDDTDHQGICPVGWRLPNDSDWDNLISAVGSNAGTKLKSQTGWNFGGNGTDDFGFSALPGGRRFTDGSFFGVGNFGYWWSATELDASNARRRYMGYGSSGVRSHWDYECFGFSVRCSQD